MDKKTGYGVDVALNRADDLDKMMLSYAAQNAPVTVLDIGSGAGGQTIRLAKVGATVTAVDICDFSFEIKSQILANNLSEDSINFIQGNITDIIDQLKNKKYDLVILQRMLHYLTYEEATKLLLDLRDVTAGNLYLSITGLDSDIGRNYSEKSVPINNRFARLNAADRDIFAITKPVCLYSEAEVTDLLSQTGWKIEKLWISAFGNIKAICSCK